jgi:hypothetical protein
MPLENHYAGDDAFARFASAADPALDARIAGWDGWGGLVAACRGDTLLARALVRVIGDEAAAWLDTCPPVLEGWSGAECLGTPAGRARLREAVMRFPHL